MKRDPVDSSNLKSIGYDPQKQLLEVEFHNGTVQEYKNVPPAKHQELMAAKSIGGHFHVHIRNFYKSRRVG